jgi:hypothetical protein
MGEAFTVIGHMEYAHFPANGFVMLRGVLSQEEAETPEDEITTAMSDAHGPAHLGDSSDFTGVSRF